MINYYCPDFYAGISIYSMLKDIKQERPDIFYDNVNIKAIFGMFPFSIWNGGGYSFGIYDYDDVYQTYEFYEELNIPLQFTLTNPCFKESDLYDTKSNYVINLFHKKENMVLVSTDLMETYIKDTYPKYKICRSIINTKEDYDFNSALNKYYNIVLPRRHNNNLDILNSISEDKRSHVEILCNDPCPPDCSHMYNHYELYGKAVLGECSVYETQCNNVERLSNIFKECAEYKILYDDIMNTYLPLEYNSFKISGRGSAIEVAFNIVNYLIKPEYRVRILYILISTINQ